VSAALDDEPVPPMTHPELVYKIATAEVVAAAEARGEFPRMPIDDQDGFVHFSTAAQLPETLRLHFAGQDDLVLLAVRSRDLGQGLVWEPSRGGELFPHVYGEIAPAAQAWKAPLAVAADGTCRLPAAVR
jgi:uncharacterized protein (DUF952 family)